MSSAPTDRKRTHPEQRFAPPQEVFDLTAAADKLEREEPTMPNGHRQIALFKHGPATVALFSFDADDHMVDHVVDGPVMIHALSGRAIIKTDDGEHDLSAGKLLRLAPGVKHDVTAKEPTRLLVTICLEGPGSHHA